MRALISSTPPQPRASCSGSSHKLPNRTRYVSAWGAWHARRSQQHQHNLYSGANTWKPSAISALTGATVPEASSVATVPAAEAMAMPSAPATLPATYRRLVASGCGSSFREVAIVREVEMRPPGPGEVLIRILYAGVNGGCETFRARGEHAFAANQGLRDFPLGAEGAGRVAALGPGVVGLAVGQLVAVNGAAAFAEYVTARASLVVPVGTAAAAAPPAVAPAAAGPGGVDGGSGTDGGGDGGGSVGIGAAAAVALVLSGVTACVALEATARIRPGEVVVVTAAAGGTGHLALQLAAEAGATVVAVVGGPAKAAAAVALGAHHVIDYRREDLFASLRRLFPGGVDCVYEGVGGGVREALLGCLAPTGRLLQVGYISEYPHTRTSSSKSSSSSRSSSAAGGGACSPSAVSAASSAGSAGSSEGCGAAASSSPAGPAEPAGCGARGGGSAGVPPSSELFWGGLDVAVGQQRIIGQIWPKDLKSLLRCRKRVFDLARSGRLRVITDEGHGRQGVVGVADAVEYMLRGGHVGKVVIRIAVE